MVKNEFNLSPFFDDIESAETIMEKVRLNFIRKRKEMKLTQKQLSASSGVSYASLRRFETTGEISFFSLLSLAEKLNSLEEFLNLFPKKRVTELKEDFLND